MDLRNSSAQVCADRKNVIQERENPIAEGDFKWIFAVTVQRLNCNGFTSRHSGVKFGGTGIGYDFYDSWIGDTYFNGAGLFIFGDSRVLSDKRALGAGI